MAENKGFGLKIYKINHFAYNLVHFIALVAYFFLSLIYSFAISGHNASSGFGSPIRLIIDITSFYIVIAGLHSSLCLNISRHISPLPDILG